MTKEQSFIFLILVIGGIIVAGFCFAQGTGISVSPLTFELTANPGDTVPSNSIKVYNPTDNIMSIKMEAEDWRPEGETGQVIVEPEAEMTYSLKRWVKIDPVEFTLGPKEQKFVNFTIEVPENAEPGGKYGSILASTTGMVKEGTAGAVITQKVGALILLTVSGEAEENLIIKEFSVSSFFEYGPVLFTIRFENTGSVHVRPKGFIAITNWRDKKVADVEFSQLNVIPRSVRKIENKWDKKWLFGKYTAMLVGSYGIDNLPISSEILTFWVVPWRITLGILIVLILIFLFFYKTRRRWQMALRILFKGEQK